MKRGNGMERRVGVDGTTAYEVEGVTAAFYSSESRLCWRELELEFSFILRTTSTVMSKIGIGVLEKLAAESIKDEFLLVYIV